MPYIISSGESSVGIVLENDTMTVLDSGVAMTTTVNSEGRLYVSSGGTANSTTVNKMGEMYVSSSGLADETTLNNGGRIYVSGGGSANSVTVNEGGILLVFSGGMAGSTMLNDGGSLQVSSGGTASGTIIGEWGMMNVYLEGLADGTTINNGGSMFVSSGGIANDTTVNSRGILEVSSGGIANDTTVNSRGILDVSIGGTADHTTVISNGSIFVFSGGTADHTTVDVGGYIRISSGGTATGIIENGGFVNDASGAAVSFVEHTFSGCVLTNASATLHSGTTANDITVGDWGILYVYSGGTANRASVDGLISILGGTANSATINSDGSMHIRSGGTADHTTVNAGGFLYVSSGGTATNIVWTPCEGHVELIDGGSATFASEYSGVYCGSGNKLLSSAAVMDGKTLDAGFEMYVMTGGTATGATVNENGELNVSAGGMADHATVNDGGELYVYSGGTANSPTVNDDGSLDVSGGTATGATVRGNGEMCVYSGAAATDIMLSSGGKLYVQNGGAAAGIVENGGYAYCENGATVTFVPNSFSELVLSDASATVHSGTMATGITVMEGARFVVCGGTANSTTVNVGGEFIVSGGGTANNATVNEGGELQVYSDGIATDVTVNLMGYICISDGGTATGILENGGYVEVNDGTTVTFLSNMLSGLVLEDGRYATVHSNTTATSTAVNYDGGLYILGGQADHTTVNDGGELTVANGTADITTVNDRGYMLVSLDGSAADVTVRAGGRLETGKGGRTTGIEVDSGGNMLVFFDGTATDIAIRAGGSLKIESGGLADGIKVDSGGNAFVDADGTATDLSVSAGGTLELGDGGTIQSAAILSGGVITGHVDCTDITFDPGAILQFDLSAISPGNEIALVDLAGLAHTQNSPSFSLPVADSQAYGDYKLAEGASGFEGKTITVSNSVMEFGLLSLDRSLVVGSREYTLNLNGGDLVLSVNTAQPTQYVYLDFDGEDLVRYDNPDLELSFDLSVADPAFSEEQRSAVVSALSERYGKYNIAFTLERPADVEYSTLYFGVSSAFDEYGDFFGVAEAYDGNNQVRDDNAFVLLDSGYSDEQVISVASHMLDHLMGFSYSGSVDGSPAILKYAESKALLSLSAGWNQKDPYNKYCPIDSQTGDRCVVGCTNTAASQIIYYWLENGLLDFTLTLADSDAYRSNEYILIESTDDPASGHLSFAKTNELLQSFNILDENCIAALCFAAGVVQQADYSSGETGTAWRKKLFVRSGFEMDEEAEQYAIDIRFDDYNILVYELLHGRPVGISLLRQEHAIVADGYDSARDMFHLDLGWGNDSNRWYTREEMDDLRIYVEISGYTPAVSPVLTVGDLSAGTGVVYLGKDVSLSFTVSNDGREVSAETMAYVYCGDAILGACGVNYISPGYSRDFTCTVNTASLKVGENTLTVKVASQNGEGTVSSASVTVTCRNGDVVPQTQTWEKIAGAMQYIVEYSTDDFEHVVQLVADTNALNSYQLPEGSYQVRVKSDVDEEWTEIEPVVAEKVNDDPKLVRSNADSNADAFYVNPVGIWEKGFAAQHVGSADDTWGGTKECVKLAGRNKLTDIFEGSSTDANVLLMTDDDNGDALFVDDIYSASPGELGLSQSRIAQIDEIRAGAGDDIIDMTSNKFEYTGDGLVIRGGDGDDVIWANKGDNLLFGDAGNDRIVGASGDDVIVGGSGNDRMHGGGGDDVFTFCENWGIDTIEQLAGCSVTLWFASGSMDNWDADTRTYSDGTNSVTVKGGASVALKFGTGTTPSDAELFAALSDAGAFDAFTSRKIFEESGTLASL